MKKNLFNLKTVVVLLGLLISTTANAAFTAVASGNWSNPATWGGIAPTATVSNQDITIPSGITVTLDADVTFAGLLNSFTINGTLSSSTNNEVMVTQGALAGSGQISIYRISLSGLSTASFSGNMNVKRLMNSVGVLGFTAITTISDTLELEAGNILLNTNANLTMAANSTVKVNDGSMTINGGIFNSGNAYNVMYVGTSKTTGIELNTVTLKHVYLNMNSNSQTVTLGNDMTVNGDIAMTMGRVALNGNHLTMNGNLTIAGGSYFISTAASEITIGGSGALSNGITFSTGSAINNFTMNRNVQIDIENSLAVAGHLNLNNGTLRIMNNAILTANAGSTIHIEKGSLSVNTGTFDGTAAYNVEYMGSTNATAGPELSGSGLTNLKVDYASSSNNVSISNSVTVNGNLNMNRGNLNLNGEQLMLNGTIAQNTNARFTGSSTSELYLNLTAVTNDTLFFDGSTSGSQSLGKLTLNTPTTSAIVLGSALNIENELHFTSGKIELSNSDLTIMSAASITGYSDTRYIITSQNASGSVVMNVNSGSVYVTFPIGTSSNYSPAHVQQTSGGASGNFSVRAMNTVLSAGTSGAVNSNVLKVVNRTWFVTSSASSVNANLKFGWMAAAEVNGFDRTNAYVTHYTSSAWDVTTAGSAVSAANNTYELSRMGITSLSPFAVTEVGQGVSVKEVTANNFELFPNPAKDLLTIKLINTTGNCIYELTDITGKVIFKKSNDSMTNTFNISNLDSGCYFIKLTSLSDNKTSTSRFIKE